MTRTLAELKALCERHGIRVGPARRASKAAYVRSLGDHLWSLANPGRQPPEQTAPMLLGDWRALSPAQAASVEADGSGWCVQEKYDGVRALLHVTDEAVRVTGRATSTVTFRLAEFQANLPHLTIGFDALGGTVLDGELVSPKADVDTGEAVTTHPLQAAVAVLATTPDRAVAIQTGQHTPLRFVAFDVLRFAGEDVTRRPLQDRLPLLTAAHLAAENPHLSLARAHTTDKGDIHRGQVADGKEGTVWKRLDQPYQVGQRVPHWLKRKAADEVEAVATGFKPGTPGRGNARLVGAVEFSTTRDGVRTPVAWVSNWSDAEREQMSRRDGQEVVLAPEILGRRAVIRGQGFSGQAGRLRHARSSAG